MLKTVLCFTYKVVDDFSSVDEDKCDAAVCSVLTYLIYKPIYLHFSAPIFNV